MKIANLIQLLQGAHTRYQQAHCVWAYRYNAETLNRVLSRTGYATPLTSSTTANLHETPYAGVTYEIWWQKPDRWRQDVLYENGSFSRLFYQGGRWCSISNISIQANSSDWRGWPADKAKLEEYEVPLRQLVESHPLLDPAFLLTSYTLRILGSAEALGRAVLNVETRLRQDSLWPADPFWTSADRYLIQVDQERGVLLRYAAEVEDDIYAIAEVQKIDFDQPVTANMFEPFISSE